MKKNLGASNWVRNQGFCCFLKVESLVFLDIAQGCSLQQCLTSSRAETSKKSFFGPNWGRNDLFYFKVVKHPLKLACYFCCCFYREYAILNILETEKC